MEERFIRINDLNKAELLPYVERSERQLLRFFEPEPGVFVAESPNVIRRALQGGYEALSFLIEEKQLQGDTLKLLSDYPSVPVYTGTEDVLKNIIGFQLTRGVLCLLRRKEYPAVEELIRNAKRIAVLEEVVNPTNVGAIFRSAAALGVEAVLLTKGCSDPLYRRAARVSMGTVFQVPWTYFPEEKSAASEESSPNIWTEQLHQLGFKTLALALRDDSYSLEDPKLQKIDRMAIVLGTEGEGLKSSTIADCDYTVKIPMTHNVDSLNVAAASAVAFWQLCMR